MAHIRPALDGFEVGLDAAENKAVEEAGITLIEVAQQTPAVSPVFTTEEAARAFLSGWNCGVRAAEEIQGVAAERAQVAGDEFLAVDHLPAMGAAVLRSYGWDL